MFRYDSGLAVEQLVQGKEMRALYIPVRVLNLGEQINAVGNPGLYQRCNLFASGNGKIDARVVHGLTPAGGSSG